MKKILSFFPGVKKPEELIGKTICINFYHDGDDVYYTCVFQVIVFTFFNSELSFASIEFGQAPGRIIQLSVFPDGFHVVIVNNRKPDSTQPEAYFYKGLNKQIKNNGLSRGSFKVLN